MTAVFPIVHHPPRGQGQGHNGIKVISNITPTAQLVHSRITVYRNTRIELKWKRAVHHCDECDLGPGATPGVRGHGHPCGAVHYGRCTPVSYPFPQNFRKKSPISPSVTGSIPIAKVTPTRPVKVIQEVMPEEKPSEDEVDVAKAIRDFQNNNLTVPGSGKEILTKDQPKVEKSQTSLKERNKENKDLSPPSSTAGPTITVSHLDSKKDLKNKRSKEHSRNKLLSVRNTNVPKFYFPFGKPMSSEETDSILQQVAQVFSRLEGGRAYIQHMAEVTKKCKLPMYWKGILFHAAKTETSDSITLQTFTAMWKRVFLTCHDPPSQFISLLTKSERNYLQEEDFIPLIQDVVDTHPGLTFLQEAPAFHSRYVNTVISRIFYEVNRSWSGRITIPELRRSNFLQTLNRLEQEEDINRVLQFFSYEHFYVIYCKFWELDKDHDLMIDKSDLARHNDHAVNIRAIDRIFSGCVTKGKLFKEGKMSYQEFVWFILSEEDKRHPTSIEYWFRVMDIDGDGVLSMYEMEYFYDEQVRKMEEMGIEKLPFEDCLCQMLDLVGPRVDGQVTLADLKSCKMTNIFFDTFLNLDKFLEHEQRDPFANARDLESDLPEPTDWEKYAAEEYENLVAEEGANEQEEILYEDDFEPDEDEIIQRERANLTETLQRNSPVLRTRNSAQSSVEDDIYDFSTSGLNY